MFLIFGIVRRLVVLAAVLAIPAVALELVARKVVGDAVASQVKTAFGGAPAVDFGSTPLLEQIAEGHVNVTITDARAAVAGLPPAALSASFEDVHMTSLLGLHGAIGSVTATAGLGPHRVRALLASSGCITALPASALVALTDRPRVRLRTGRITLLPPHGRAVVVRVVPLESRSRLAFDVVSVTADGQAIAGAGGGCVAAVGALPFGLAFTGVSATNGMLELAFSGHGASFTG